MIEKTLSMLKGEPAQKTMVSALARKEPFHHVEVVTCDLRFWMFYFSIFFQIYLTLCTS